MICIWINHIRIKICVIKLIFFTFDFDQISRGCNSIPLFTVNFILILLINIFILDILILWQRHALSRFVLNPLTLHFPFIMHFFNMSINKIAIIALFINLYSGLLVIIWCIVVLLWSLRVWRAQLALAKFLFDPSCACSLRHLMFIWSNLMHQHLMMYALLSEIHWFCLLHAIESIFRLCFDLRVILLWHGILFHLLWVHGLWLHWSKRNCV